MQRLDELRQELIKANQIKIHLQPIEETIETVNAWLDTKNGQ